MNVIVTLINQYGISDADFSKFKQLCSKLNVKIVSESILNERCAIEYRAVSSKQVAALQKLFFENWDSSENTDLIVQADSVFRRHKRLAVFDMDSTLIKQEVIDELAREAGIVDKVKAITEEAMNGRLDFKESLKRRVQLLENLSTKTLETVKDRLEFNDGAKDLIRALKRLGYVTVLLSGGFVFFAQYVAEALGIDHYRANNLEFNNAGTCLTGKTSGTVVDGAQKARYLTEFASTLSLPKSQIVAVGDGANDLEMLSLADLGIAFNAKKVVQERASARINQPSLINVLYLLGFTAAETQELFQ